MWRSRRKAWVGSAWLVAVASLGMLTAGMSGQSAPPDAQAWPDTPGGALVRSRCLVCHQTDLIQQQRLTRDGWQREVDKMVRWGAKVDGDAERQALIDALASAEGSRAPDAEAAARRGEVVFNRQCTVCHQTDLVAQQRLTTAGWAREVDKMVRWGAAVADPADKAALVDYLAGGPFRKDNP